MQSYFSILPYLSSNQFIGNMGNQNCMVIVHNFKQTTGSQFSIQQYEACHKGFMKQALRYVGELAKLVKLTLTASKKKQYNQHMQ